MIEERQATAPAAPHGSALGAGEGPRVAEPVQHEQHGAPAGDRRARRVAEARRQARGRGFVGAERHALHDRPRAARPRVPRERAGAGGHPALEARGGAREEARAAVPPDALLDEVARVPAGRVRRLVGRILLVDHDREAERRERKPRGRPGPDGEARRPGAAGPPCGPARARGGGARDERGPLVEPRLEAQGPRPSQLDLRREDEGAPARGERLRDAALDPLLAGRPGDKLCASPAGSRAAAEAASAARPRADPAGARGTRPLPRRSPSRRPPSA